MRNCLRMVRCLSLLAMWMVFISFSVSYGAEFSGGTGDPNDPYLVESVVQLTSIGADPNLLDKHFALTADINLDPNLPGGRIFDQAVIAPDANTLWYFQGVAFSGSFDGRGFGLYNLTIDANESGYIGLFGSIGASARIYDVNLLDMSIQGENFVGGLAGQNMGTVVNCHVTGDVIGFESQAGGLLGWNEGFVGQCSATGSVSVGRFSSFGGLVGNNQGTITACHAFVDVSALDRSRCLGGLVGENKGVIQDSFAVGHVSGGAASMHLGGLVGENARGHVTRCYATGSVNGKDNSWDLGGLLGGNIQGVVSLCKATGQVTGGQSSRYLGGLVGGSGGVMVNAYATGNVFSGEKSSDVGGIVGNHMYGTMTNCYALGAISCGDESRNIGGLVGVNLYSDISACFWDIQSSDLTESPGGTGLNTVQFQDTEAFSVAGWDWMDERANGTADLWILPEGATYPELVVFLETYQRPELEGTGTRKNPYQIYTAEDLGAINHRDINACYKLQAALDLSDIQWATACVSGFNGWFDGNSLAISGLTIQGNGALGLFGTLYDQAEVSQVIMQNASVTGNGRYLSLLAACNHGGYIRDCDVTGVLTGTDETLYLGGLVGIQYDGQEENCQAACQVSGGQGSRDVGGLIGCLMEGTLIQCQTSGRVTAGDEARYIGGLVGFCKGTLTGCSSNTYVNAGESSTYLGGLVGINAQGTIAQSCARGNVRCGVMSQYIGGFAGQNSYYDKYGIEGKKTLLGIIVNSYATGNLLVGRDCQCVGGLVGWHMAGDVHHSYAAGGMIYGRGSTFLGGYLGAYSSGATYDGYFLSPFYGGGPYNGMGIPLTLSRMVRQSSYVDWDFAETWTIQNGQDTPRLWWELTPKD